MQRIGRFIKLIIGQIVERDLLTQSAALSFYAALSLAPLIILMMSFLSMMGAAFETSFLSQVNEVIGPKAAEAVQLIIQSAKESKDSRSLSNIGGLFMLFISASGVFVQLKFTISNIFDQEPDTSSSTIMLWLKERVFSVGMVVSFIFISAVSLILSAVITFFSPEANQIALRWLNNIIALLLYSGIFYLVFEFIPRRKLYRPTVIIGSLITGLLFMLGKGAIGLYIGSSAAGSSYGAAGSLVVLLIWVYYSSFIVFISAVAIRALSTFVHLRKALKNETKIAH